MKLFAVLILALSCNARVQFVVQTRKRCSHVRKRFKILKTELFGRDLSHHQFIFSELNLFCEAYLIIINVVKTSSIVNTKGFQVCFVARYFTFCFLDKEFRRASSLVAISVYCRQLFALHTTLNFTQELLRLND